MSLLAHAGIQTLLSRTQPFIKGQFPLFCCIPEMFRNDFYDHHLTPPTTTTTATPRHLSLHSTSGSHILFLSVIATSLDRHGVYFLSSNKRLSHLQKTRNNLAWPAVLLLGRREDYRRYPLIVVGFYCYGIWLLFVCTGRHSALSSTFFPLRVTYTYAKQLREKGGAVTWFRNVYMKKFIDPNKTDTSCATLPIHFVCEKQESLEREDAGFPF